MRKKEIAQFIVKALELGLSPEYIKWAVPVYIEAVESLYSTAYRTKC